MNRKSLHLILPALLLAAGCYMNNMTTARTVGAGKVGLTGGVGAVPFAVTSDSGDPLSFDTDVVLTLPQTWLDIGEGAGFIYALSAGIHIESSESFRLIGDWTTYAFAMHAFGLGARFIF